MAIKPLAELDDFKLVDSDQDCRGWPVVDAAGVQIGNVLEMLVDTGNDRVTALVLDSGVQIAVETVSLIDGKVRVEHDTPAR